MSRKHTEIDPERGRRLKSLLVKSKVTQCSIAKKLCYEPQHISNIVCGKRQLTAELAQRIVDEVFPDINVEWLLNRSDCETIAEKEMYSKKIIWEENERVSAFYDKVFRCFIAGLEDMRGYGLCTGELDLLGKYIAVTNAIGEPVGAVPVESFKRLQAEVENYASYLVQRIIKNEMGPIPESGKEGIEKWLIFKNAGTNRAG